MCDENSFKITLKKSIFHHFESFSSLKSYYNRTAIAASGPFLIILYRFFSYIWHIIVPNLSMEEFQLNTWKTKNNRQNLRNQTGGGHVYKKRKNAVQKRYLVFFKVFVAFLGSCFSVKSY